MLKDAKSVNVVFFGIGFVPHWWHIIFVLLNFMSALRTWCQIWKSRQILNHMFAHGWSDRKVINALNSIEGTLSLARPSCQGGCSCCRDAGAGARAAQRCSHHTLAALAVPSSAQSCSLVQWTHQRAWAEGAGLALAAAHSSHGWWHLRGWRCLRTSCSNTFL